MRKLLMSLGLLLISIGFLGLALATFALPIIVSQFCLKTPTLEHRDPVPSLSIWITAHNEEKVIFRTLESVFGAIRHAVSNNITFRYEIGVALDHCTDQTLEQIRQFEVKMETKVQVINNLGPAAKWWNLKNILTQKNGSWTALVDGGSIWDSKLLTRAMSEIKNDVVAIAPSYSAQRSGLLERMNWKLEAYLKSFENRAGGPVSIHGATVFYRTDTLRFAFSNLGEELWLNDDVAIPLSLRLQSTKNRIVYLADHPTGWVSDLGVRSELVLEYRRRRRMVFGNIQWIQNILFTRKGIISPIPFCLALRRVFRLFWAYWVFLIGFGIFLTNPLFGGILLIMLVIGSVQSRFLRRVGMAFASGLQVPKFWLLFSLTRRGTTWN